MVSRGSQNKEDSRLREIVIIKQISEIVKEICMYSFIAGREVTEEAVVSDHVLHVSKVEASPGTRLRSESGSR